MFKVHIVGSNSALPVYGRHPSCQYIQHKHHAFLLDCGEGSQMRLNDLKLRQSKIEAIFITHLHGDHYFGLPGFLTSSLLLNRVNPLVICAPEKLKNQMTAILSLDEKDWPYSLEWRFFTPDEGSKIVYETDFLEIWTVPLTHRDDCCGFLMKEKPHPKKYIKEIGDEVGVPIEQINAIKKGADFVREDGSIVPNNKLTRPGEKVKSYAYLTDTAFKPDVCDQIEYADLLYHEATFLEEQRERAIQTEHSTAMDAANIAKMAKVTKLIIGHPSAKIKDVLTLVEEAQTIFPNTEFAEEGKFFTIE